ncbi:ras GEF [Agrocybe pediades]|nr:ras GEF [Agrocybe pediades]
MSSSLSPLPPAPPTLRRRIRRIRLEDSHLPVIDISPHSRFFAMSPVVDNPVVTIPRRRRLGDATDSTDLVPMTDFFPALVPHFNALWKSYQRDSVKEFCRSAQEIAALFEFLLAEVAPLFAKSNLLHDALSHRTRKLVKSLLYPVHRLPNAQFVVNEDLQDDLMRKGLYSAKATFEHMSMLISLAMRVSGARLVAPRAAPILIDFTPPRVLSAWDARSSTSNGLPLAEVTYSLDVDGKIKTVCLSAIVVILTSEVRHKDPEFVTTVMTFFRFFSSPSAFLSALIQRYEKPTTVLLRDPHGNVVQEPSLLKIRNRVFKILLSWVSVYWRPEDASVLKDMRVFVDKCTMCGLDMDVRANLQSCLTYRSEQAEEATSIDPITEDNLQHCAHRNLPGAFQVQLLPTTNFKFPRKQPASLDNPLFVLNSPSLHDQLFAFDSRAGREEFSRQLTLVLYDIMSDIDAYDAVDFWRRSKSSVSDKKLVHLPPAPAIKKLGTTVDALSLWVSKSVICAEQRKQRVRLIGFWLDIASICLQQKNFIGSCAIKSGVAYSAVTRMKETMRTVGKARKAQLRQLEHVFDPSGNYSRYREILKDETPILPLPAVLYRDIHTSYVAAARSRTIQDGNRDLDLLSIKSYRIMLRSMQTIERSHMPFPFPRHEMCQEWISRQLTEFSENIAQKWHTLDDLSKQSEPSKPVLKTFLSSSGRVLLDFKGRQSGTKWKTVDLT